MTKHLNDLLETSGKAGNDRKISKKMFISLNFEKIDKALKLGNSHEAIISALEKDGVKFTYSYFSQLLSAEYQARGLNPKFKKHPGNGKPSVKTVESKSSATGSALKPDPVKKADSSSGDESQALKDELDRIRKSDMTLIQKREAIAAATASAKNANPLADRK